MLVFNDAPSRCETHGVNSRAEDQTVVRVSAVEAMAAMYLM
jgi:hypothetical protein